MSDSISTISPQPRDGRALAARAMHFDLDEEIASLKSENTWVTQSQNARTLIKYDDFRVVLVALKKGAHMKEHSVGQHLTVQTVTGSLRVLMPHGHMDLAAGHVMGLERAVLHDVEATEEAVFLLTMGWSSAPA